MLLFKPEVERMLQGGFQMFMARMDDELLHYWNAPCNTPYMKK